MAPTYFLNKWCCRLSKQVLSTYLYYTLTVHMYFYLFFLNHPLKDSFFWKFYLSTVDYLGTQGISIVNKIVIKV